MNFRFSIMTINLWNTEMLELRTPVIVNFFNIHKPDILCIQEIREQLIEILDDTLIGYERVHDDLPSWNRESNIYYKKDLFDEVEHGKVNLNMPETDRGLFYIKLKNTYDNKELFISTVHLTHQGNADECATGKSYRHLEANLIVKSIKNLIKINEPALICGDFNDPFHPYRIIKEQLGWIEVFHALKLIAPITFPCEQNSKEIYLVESLDKIVANSQLYPIMATSPHFVGPVGISDHYPVEAMFEVI